MGSDVEAVQVSGLSAKPSQWQSPLLNVMLFSVFWALSVFISKVAFNAGASPITFSIQSSVVAFIMLIAYALPRKIGELKTTGRGVIIWLIAAYAFHMGLGDFLSNIGIAYTSALNAGFLVKFSTVTTTLLAWFILREKMTPAKLLTVLAILIGTYLLTAKGQLIAPHLGDVLIIVSCLCWSTGNILVRRALKYTSLSGEAVALIRPLGGFPIFIIFVLLSPLYPASVQKIFVVNFLDLHYLFYVIIDGILGLLTLIYLNRTLKVASASYMTMMSSITPLLVAVLAVIFLKDSLIFIQVTGAALIISSSFVTYFLKTEHH